MKIELWIGGARTAAVFAEFLPKWTAAAAVENSLRSDTDLMEPTVATAEAPEATVEPEPAPAEKPKRTRKAAEPAPQPEPAPNITATPEAREPVAEPEPAKEITKDDVDVALRAVVNKFGVAYATANVQRLIGAPRLSAVDPATYPEVLARLEAELAVEDING